MADETTVKPVVGEQTKPQTTSGGIADAFADVFGMPSAVKGYDPAPPGTFKTYRKMRRNPTITLGRVVAAMPIKTAEVAFEAKDDASDDAVELVQGVLEPLWPSLLRDMLLALDFGFAAFEKVWEINGDGRLVLRKIKPLLPDKTELLVDKQTGAFTGLKQGDVTLNPAQCFLYSNEPEFGDLHGQSRHEAVRDTWWQWEQVVGREGQYTTKIASVIPQVEYPEGKSRDASGAEQDNFELAKRVLANLGRGSGVAMPNTLAKHAQDLVRAGVDITKLKAWNISFLETTGQHAAGLLDILRHKESLMLRGWLVPERSATEAQVAGSRADSESHADIGVAVAEVMLDDILSAVNAGLVNPLLRYNFGPRAVGGVYMTTAGLSTEQKAFTRQVMSAVLVNPANVDLFLKLIDFDALLDQTGLPKAAEVLDVSDVSDVAPARGSEEPPSVQRQASRILAAINQRR